MMANLVTRISLVLVLLFRFCRAWPILSSEVDLPWYNETVVSNLTTATLLSGEHSAFTRSMSSAQIPVLRAIGFDPDRYNRLQLALADAIQILETVMQQDFRTDPNTRTIFLRYFQAGMEDAVKQVFRAILGNGDFNPKFLTRMTIYNNALVSGVPDLCAPPFFADAFTIRRPNRYADVVICDGVWTDERRDKVLLSQVSCDQLGTSMLGTWYPNVVSDAMVTLGAILIHEFTHWDYIIEDAPLIRQLTGASLILDFNLANRLDVGNPFHGYGATNAMRLNRLRVNGQPLPLNEGPLMNADSYTIFAMDLYWSNFCGRMFQPALHYLEVEACPPQYIWIGTNPPPT